MLSVALGGGGCMRRRPTTARFGHVWVAKISKKMAFSALNPQIFSGQQAQFCGPLDTGAPAPDPCSDAHPRQPLRVVATQGPRAGRGTHGRTHAAGRAHAGTA